MHDVGRHWWVFEDVVVNGTDVCVIYDEKEDEEFEEIDLANGIACDCSNSENFDFEDEGVCNDAHEDDPIWGNEDGVEYFMALICGEPLPEISDDDDEDDEEGLSLETMCYLFNYERFTQNGPGPDYEASEWPTIFPKGSIEIDDSCDENGCNGDFCTATQEGEHSEPTEIPCNCNQPEEFIKNMFNKDVCEEFKEDFTPEKDMTQAGLDNFESLVCGFQINFLSFGLILLCTLFKF